MKSKKYHKKFDVSGNEIKKSPREKDCINKYNPTHDKKICKNNCNNKKCKWWKK